ncbi:MAG: ComEC/Rec2 family competence protein, partial [Thermodesulfobacteriota bacterium]|nr:ComEC/Rec2 family competence protein [Thermodesulfobacteriota bacterium]
MNQTKFYLPPLVLPFLSLSTGILFGNFLPGFRTSASVFIFIIISALVFTKFCWLLKPRFRLSINNNPGLKNESFKRESFLFKRESCNYFYVILFFFVGYVLISSFLFPHVKDNHISKFTDQGKFWIIGKIVSTPEKSGRKKRLVLSVKRVGKDALNTVPATGRIKLSIYSQYGRDSNSSTVKYGDLIKFKAKIKSIHNFKNPGGFDYKRYLRLKNIYASSFTSRKNIVFLSEKKEHRLCETLLGFMEDYRENFSQFIVTHVKDKKSAAVLSALITGKKDLLDKKTRNDFSKAGASHVLAISGLHLSVVATLFFYLFNKILSLFTFLLIRGWSRKGAALLTLIPLLFYAFL